MTTVGVASRRVALAAVRRVEDDGAYSTIAVPEAVAALDERRDRDFASALAYETLRWRGTLDWALATVLDRKMDDVEVALRHVLRLGAVQLMRMDVPARAAVSTAVELARDQVPGSRARGASGFVNGVLRGLARAREELPWPAEEDDRVAHLRLRTAHPDWIVTDLLERFDPAETADILTADNDPPGLTLRADGDRDALVRELRDAGIDATPTEHARDGVRAPGADPRRLSAVAEGRARPQDEASMLVAEATGARRGDRVLELCAGPGGKATHLARVVGAAGAVTAVELHSGRAELITEAARRHGVDVDVRVGDATDPPLDSGEAFDVVLVDAPCTGLGTGRRRPEIRWRRTPDDAAELADLQRRLLAAAAARARPGGRLVYAVCTWTAAETTGVTAAHPDVSGWTEQGERQLLPHREGTDGMYLRVWTRPRQ